MQADSSWAESVLLGGKLLFALAGLAAGTHVLRLARSERGLGRHTLAAAAIAVGSVGLVLFPLARMAAGAIASRAIFVAAELCLRGGLAFLALFVWKAFRPESRAARAGTLACIGGLFATFAWEISAQHSAGEYDASLPSAWAAQLSFAIPFGWSCLESTLEWQRARRRMALGLSDRATANRFALWSLATGALVGICLLANAVGWSQSHGQAEAAEALTALRGILYLPAVAAVWVGIFTPRWYQRRLAAAEASRA